jgi:hypothetical protein
MFLISLVGNGEVRLLVTKVSLIHSTKQTNLRYCMPNILEETAQSGKRLTDLLNTFLMFKYTRAMS